MTEGPRVLQLTSSRRSFFDQQVDALEAVGLPCETVSVPPRDGRERGRGAREYLSFYLRSLGRGLEAFDVVHVNYGLLGPLGLAQPTRPVVLTLWGSDLMGAEWLRSVSRLSARFSDAVVVPTERMGRALDCPHEVIPFGVDTDLFRPIPREKARERVGWIDGGREGDSDGGRDGDSEEHPDSTLNGTDGERVVLFPYPPDREVKNYALAERVVERVPDATLRTVSGVPHERMPDYLNASDAVLITSERESGPMVLKEAAACNVPVVSLDVGFAADVLGGISNSAVADGEEELAGRLTELLDGAARSNGRETIDGLDPAEMGDRLAGVYRSVLPENGR